LTTYQCTYETRKNSSEGAFFPESRTLDAANVKAAMAAAFDQLHAEGYETRNPVSCSPLGGEKLAGESLRQAMQ
jgi:hypothetical protein